MVRFFNILLLFSSLGVSFFLFGSGRLYAHHPNEGALELKQLINEVLEKNSELKSSRLLLESSFKSRQAAQGSKFPELSLEGGPLSTKHDDEINSGTSYYAKIEWNLYRGGKDVTRTEIKDLESDLVSKKHETLKSQIEREVAKVYYELLFLLESLALKERALKMNQEQIKMALAKKRAGFVSNADVIEFELRDATLKSDLKKLFFEKSEKSRELSFILGRTEISENLSVKGHLNKETFSIDRKKFIQNIEHTNAETIEVKTEKNILEKEKSIIKSEFHPQVDFEGKFGKLASEEKVFKNSNNYSFMLKLKIPLFSGFSTRNELLASHAKFQSKELSLERKVLALKTEAENLFAAMDLIQDRLTLEEKTLQRSEEYYNITMTEYRRGVKNSPDLVAATEKLLDAKIRNLEFRRDFFLTRLRLSALMGLSSNE